MNKKNSNKNITITSEAKIQTTGQQNRFLSYKFEIMDDENIYSVSFNGNLTRKETQKMLRSIRNYGYEKMADGIRMYLEQHNMTYTGFIASNKPMEHCKTMELTKMFLHSKTTNYLDKHIGNIDVYYTIMDHQQPDNKNHCAGCYIAAERTSALYRRYYKYNIVGQIFNCNETTDDEKGYFVIRENKNSRHFYNLDKAEGELVLPTFGCIDLMSLLLNIDHIQSIEQAEKIAVK